MLIILRYYSRINCPGIIALGNYLLNPEILKVNLVNIDVARLYAVVFLRVIISD